MTSLLPNETIKKITALEVESQAIANGNMENNSLDKLTETLSVMLQYIDSGLLFPLINNIDILTTE